MSLSHAFYNGIGSEADAARLTEEHLAHRLPRRWNHTQGVARTARMLADTAPLNDTERTLLKVSAWYHDIGYAHPHAYNWHPLDGALLLRTWELDTVADLVAWHTTAAEEAPLLGHDTNLAGWTQPTGLLPDLLTYADMTTSPDGEHVTFEQRRDEIRQRHGATSTPTIAMDTAWTRLLAIRDRVAPYDNR